MKKTIWTTNWRPISLLNFSLKTFWKSLARRLKRALIDSTESVYINKRFTSKNGHLINDAIKFCYEKRGLSNNSRFHKSF